MPLSILTKGGLHAKPNIQAACIDKIWPVGGISSLDQLQAMGWFLETNGAAPLNFGTALADTFRVANNGGLAISRGAVAATPMGEFMADVGFPLATSGAARSACACMLIEWENLQNPLLLGAGERMIINLVDANPAVRDTAATLSFTEDSGIEAMGVGMWAVFTPLLAAWTSVRDCANNKFRITAINNGAGGKDLTIDYWDRTLDAMATIGPFTAAGLGDNTRALTFDLQFNFTIADLRIKELSVADSVIPYGNPPTFQNQP